MNNPFFSLIAQIPENNPLINNEEKWSGRKSNAGRKPVLTIEQRREILRLVQEGMTDGEIAKALNVQRWHAKNIRTRKRV